MTKWGGRSLNVIEELFAAGRQNLNFLQDWETFSLGGKVYHRAKSCFSLCFVLRMEFSPNFFLHQVWSGRARATGSRGSWIWKEHRQIVTWSVFLTFSSQQGMESSSRSTSRHLGSPLMPILICSGGALYPRCWPHDGAERRTRNGGGRCATGAVRHAKALIQIVFNDELNRKDFL